MKPYRLIINMISDFFPTVCLGIFTKRRYGVAATAGILTVYYLCEAALNFGRFHLSQIGIDQHYTMLLGAALGFGVEFLITEYRDSRAVFTNLLAISYGMCSKVIARVFAAARMPLGFSIAVELAGGAILLLVMVWWLLPLYRRMQELYREEWKEFSAVMLLFYICIFLMYECRDGAADALLQTIVPVVCIACLYLILLLGFFMFEHIRESEQAAREQNIMDVGMDAWKREVAAVHRSEQEMERQSRENIRFISRMRTLMDRGDYLAVEAELSKIQQIQPVDRVVRYCDNTPVNGVVAYYIREAEHQGIQIRARLDIPEHSGIDDLGLAVMIGNLLDNAIRSCGQIPDPADRKIQILGHRVKRQCIYEVRNTFSGPIEFDEETRLPVSKRGEGHGIGMQSVASFAAGHDGLMDCMVQGREFVVRLLI